MCVYVCFRKNCTCMYLCDLSLCVVLPCAVFSSIANTHPYFLQPPPFSWTRVRIPVASLGVTSARVIRRITIQQSTAYTSDSKNTLCVFFYF